MSFADLHIHTMHSYDGTSSVSATLKHVADQTNLSVIAITDHDTTTGLAEALALAPRYGIEVIPGCEVSTLEGHLLALFIHHPVPAGLSLVETVLRVGEQGGLCVAPHPTARGTHSLSFEAIREALVYPGVAGVLAGVEAFNGGLVYTRGNFLVEAQAQTLALAQVANSDAHILQMIGQGATEFTGYNAGDLREALRTASTLIHKGKGLGGADIIRRYIPRYMLRKLGWVAYNAQPDQPLTYCRLSHAFNTQQAR